MTHHPLRRPFLSRFAVVAFGLCFAAANAPAQQLPAADQCTLLTGATVITMASDDAGAPVPSTKADVLTCGTNIRAVGEAGSFELPENTKRIEAAGKFLLPGLTDGHVHIFMPLDLDLNLAWGVTTVRCLFGNPGTIVMRDRIAGGELWGPRIVTAGPIVDGDPAVWPTSDKITNAEQAQATVTRQIEAGYDFIKLYSLLDRDPFFAALAAAKKAGVQAGGHVPNKVNLKEAADAGMDFIEHLTGFLPALQGEDSQWSKLSWQERAEVGRFEGIRMQVEGFDEGKLPEVASWMVDNEVWNVPTFVVIERISASAEQKQEWMENHPQMRTIGGPTLNMWNPENDFRLQDVSAEQLAARRRSAELHAPIVKALHDAGAELMLGTDTPNPFVFPGFSVHEELQRFVDAGLTAWQALRLATVQPARFFGEADQFGQVAVGMTADLLLLDADPLVDINNTQKVRGVMTQGRWLDRGELDARLDGAAETWGNE